MTNISAFGLQTVHVVSQWRTEEQLELTCVHRAGPIYNEASTSSEAVPHPHDPFKEDGGTLGNLSSKDTRSAFSPPW